MNRRILHFWGGALGIAIAFAIAAALLLPYDALRLLTPEDRSRAWLLTLWTGGVVAVLFGTSALLGFAAPLGIREVAEAGSVTRALEARRQKRSPSADFHGNFAWWLVCTGLILIGIYFAAWGLGIDHV